MTYPRYFIAVKARHPTIAYWRADGRGDYLVRVKVNRCESAASFSEWWAERQVWAGNWREVGAAEAKQCLNR